MRVARSGRCEIGSLRFFSFLRVVVQNLPQSFAPVLPIGVAAFRTLVLANVTSGGGVFFHLVHSGTAALTVHRKFHSPALKVFELHFA